MAEACYCRAATMRAFSLLLAAPLALFSCAEDPQSPAAERGRLLLHDSALSSSPFNFYTCSTCHAEAAAQEGVIRVGAPLAGVTLRPTFWGGQENDLLRAINACLRYFMVSEPLAATDERAEALFAHLQSLEPGNPAAVPFTISRGIEDIPRVDRAPGESLYLRACFTCHGEKSTGNGRLDTDVPRLPEDTIAEHADYSARLLRLVFIEKTRHGLFLGYGGTMPPLSMEALSDAELAAILEYLGITGE